MVEFGPKLDGIRGLYLVKLRGAIDKLRKGVLLITILDHVCSVCIRGGAGRALAPPEFFRIMQLQYFWPLPGWKIQDFKEFSGSWPPRKFESCADAGMYMSQSIYNISQYINWRISIWLVHKLTDIIQQPVHKLTKIDISQFIY